MMVLFGLALLTSGWAASARCDDTDEIPGRPGEQVSPRPGPHADPLDQWLDEVKAQRRAWEERRRAAKEAVNARRRWTDPWGVAQHEAREKESQRRHDAMLEQIERDRDAFRNQVPWQTPETWEAGPPPPSSQPTPHGSQPEAGGSEQAARGATAQSPTAPPAYPPSGWDNRWYYRGY